MAGSGATAGALVIGASTAGATGVQDVTGTQAGQADSASSVEIVLDDPSRAKLATESSVLADAISADQTTFDVVTSGGAPWTTATTEFTTMTGE